MISLLLPVSSAFILLKIYSGQDKALFRNEIFKSFISGNEGHPEKG